MKWPFKKEDKKLELLLVLNRLNEFRTWRELAIDPVIAQLEDDLYAKFDIMPEFEIRARLKHIKSLKYAFHNIFKEIDAQKKLAKETDKLNQS